MAAATGLNRLDSETSPPVSAASIQRILSSHSARLRQPPHTPYDRWHTPPASPPPPASASASAGVKAAGQPIHPNRTPQWRAFWRVLRRALTTGSAVAGARNERSLSLPDTAVWFVDDIRVPRDCLPRAGDCDGAHGPTDARLLVAVNVCGQCVVAVIAPHDNTCQGAAPPAVVATLEAHIPATRVVGCCERHHTSSASCGDTGRGSSGNRGGDTRGRHCQPWRVCGLRAIVQAIVAHGPAPRTLPRRSEASHLPFSPQPTTWTPKCAVVLPHAFRAALNFATAAYASVQGVAMVVAPPAPKCSGTVGLDVARPLCRAIVRPVETALRLHLQRGSCHGSGDAGDTGSGCLRELSKLASACPWLCQATRLALRRCGFDARWASWRGPGATPPPTHPPSSSPVPPPPLPLFHTTSVPPRAPAGVVPATRPRPRHPPKRHRTVDEIEAAQTLASYVDQPAGGGTSGSASGIVDPHGEHAQGLQQEGVGDLADSGLVQRGVVASRGGGVGTSDDALALPPLSRRDTDGGGSPSDAHGGGDQPPSHMVAMEWLYGALVPGIGTAAAAVPTAGQHLGGTTASTGGVGGGDAVRAYLADSVTQPPTLGSAAATAARIDGTHSLGALFSSTHGASRDHSFGDAGMHASGGGDTSNGGAAGTSASATGRGINSGHAHASGHVHVQDGFGLLATVLDGESAMHHDPGGNTMGGSNSATARTGSRSVVTTLTSLSSAEALEDRAWAHLAGMGPAWRHSAVALLGVASDIVTQQHTPPLPCPADIDAVVSGAAGSSDGSGTGALSYTTAAMVGPTSGIGAHATGRMSPAVVQLATGGGEGASGSGSVSFDVLDGALTMARLPGADDDLL